MGRRGLSVLAILAVLGGTAASANAAMLTVSTVTDDFAANELCSLREAINAVNAPGTAGDCGTASAGANTIVLGAHTYSLTRAYPHLGPPTTGCVPGVSHSADNVYGNLSVLGTVQDLTIEGAGTSATVLDACRLGDRAFNIAPGAVVTLRDLTIANGRTPGGAPGAPGGSSGGGGSLGGDGEDGGGILNSGSLTLTRVTVRDNKAGLGGLGGNGESSNNTMKGGSGGPGGAGGSGGGIFNGAGASLTLADSTISGNAAGDGGAGGSGTTSFLGSGGDGGSGGFGGLGGGVLSRGQLTVTRTTVVGNRAGAGGDGKPGIALGAGASGSGGNGASGGSGGAAGGIGVLGGSFSPTNSTIQGNHAGNGGHSAAGGDGGGTDITQGGTGGNGGNGGTGGGIALASVTGSILLNLTVANNAVGVGQPGAPGGVNPAGAPAGTAGLDGVGGGVFVQHGAPTTFRNTLLFTNGSGGNCASAPGTAIATVVLDGGHNLTFSLPTLGNGLTPVCPATFSSGDPKLGLLQGNFGPTETMALGMGSAAIDVVPPGSGCPATDQRGFARPSGAGCDIGAYEVTPPALTPGAVTPLTSTSATVHGSARANAVHATVRLRFGRTTAYGSQSAGQVIAGIAPSALSVHLASLKPRTTYHFRWVATSPDGTSMTADASFTTPAALPRLRALRLRPSGFRVRAHGHGGTKVSYSDSQASRVSFAVQRCVKFGKHHRCKRYETLGRFTHADHAGHDSLRFSGVLAGSKLAPGRYRLAATPTANGITGNTIKARFRILA